MHAVEAVAKGVNMELANIIVQVLTLRALVIAQFGMVFGVIFLSSASSSWSIATQFNDSFFWAKYYLPSRCCTFQPANTVFSGRLCTNSDGDAGRRTVEASACGYAPQYHWNRRSCPPNFSQRGRRHHV